MSRLLLWRSEVTNHYHFDFFELHSDPCTSNSIKREESGCKIWQLHWNFKYFTKLQSKIDEMFPFQFWWQSQSKQRIKGTAVVSKSASSMMLCSSFYQNTILLISLLSPLFPFCLFVLPRTCDQEYLQRISKPVMAQPNKELFLLPS